MFFLGPSANILVYLLVSTFFVACFYIKSEPENQENLDLSCISIYCYAEEKKLTLYETTVYQAAEPLETDNVFVQEEIYLDKEHDFPDPFPDRYAAYLEGLLFRGPPLILPAVGQMP